MFKPFALLLGILLGILLGTAHASTGWYTTNLGNIVPLKTTTGDPHSYIGIIIPGADLQGVDLTYAFLIDANLQGADLQDAELQGAKLQSADLRGADLRGADLTDANLQGSKLSGADLRGFTYDLAANKFIDVKFTTLCGSGTRIEYHYESPEYYATCEIDGKLLSSATDQELRFAMNDKSCSAAENSGR